jgi:diguanylate cyclase (GGDEF)-like protein/PAS domain S-box-containing protein
MVIAIMGVIFSLTAFFHVKQWEQDRIIYAQKQQANEYIRLLRQTFTSLGSILETLRYQMKGVIKQDFFANLIPPKLLEELNISALQWIPRVTAEQYAPAPISITTKIEPFNIWELSSVDHQKQPVTKREIYYPIRFSEPSITQDQIGYDVASNPKLKLALQQASDWGQLTISGATQLPNQPQGQLGFYVFIPVYQPEDSLNLIGFVGGAFVFDKLLEGVLRLPKIKTKIFLKLLDTTDTQAPMGEQLPVLYVPAWYEHNPPTQTPMELFSTVLEIGGRTWRLVFYQMVENFFYEIGYAWLVLGIGLVLTVVLIRYIHFLLTHAHWAENLVATRTQSLSEANQALSKEIKAREQITHALELSQQRFQAVFNEAAIGIAQLDLNNRILDSNRALQNLLRYHEDELQGQFLNQLVHPEDTHIDIPWLANLLAGKYDSYQVSKRYICKNGAIVWTNQSNSIVRDTHQPFLISMIEDITERKFAEEARLEAEKKYRDIFENAIEGIFQCTPEGQYLRVNPALVRMLGYQSAEQIYTELTDIEQQLYVNPQRRRDFVNLLATQSTIADFEYQARCRDGTLIWVKETVRVVRDNQGNLRYYEGIMEDITERKQIEDKLRYDATHDQLTGLLNRAAFTTYLTRALQKLVSPPVQTETEAVATTTIAFAVLFLDLDRFKIVNSMGLLVGDQVLIEIARRLEQEICKADIVARFGGDDFALMLENIPDLSTLEQRIDTIQQHLSKPYILKNETLNTTTSIGIALASPHYHSADEILRDADTAMYEAKQYGRGKSLIFQPGMHTQVVNILRMESDLRKALEREEFKVYYQPIVSLENLHPVGLEALIRWQHPEQGFIRPDQFIPIAEEIGLIKELGLWVLETACQQLHHWQTQFVQYAHLGMNINVSPVQLKQPKLVQKIQDIIEKNRLASSTCRLEITEGAMMQDPEAALVLLNELKNLEIMLYLDDFGTGYSSLSYLQRFPIDALKIDKSFIKNIDNSLKAAQIVQAIIALGQTFDLRIVAEGVENNLQLSLLKGARCHHVQGYFFSRPQDSEAMEKYLSSTTVAVGSNYIN